MAKRTNNSERGTMTRPLKQRPCLVSRRVTSMTHAIQGIKTADRTVTAHCVKCHGVVNLEFTEWNDGGATRSQTWACPYCETPNIGDFCGQLVWAVRQPWSDVDLSSEEMADRLRRSRARRKLN